MRHFCLLLSGNIAAVRILARAAHGRLPRRRRQIRTIVRQQNPVEYLPRPVLA